MVGERHFRNSHHSRDGTGEWIEVKKPTEIEQTLNAQSRNQGLIFETDMLAFAGRRYRVAAPVHRIILEETGKMIELTNTVVLDGVTCKGLCSKNCPRANPLFWREAWLSRPNSATSVHMSPTKTCAGAELDQARASHIAPTSV